MLIVLLMTACSSGKDDEQETPTLPTEPPKLNVYVFLPERPKITRADNGDVASIDNSINEARITTLQIWVFNNSTGKLVAYYTPDTPPQPATSTSPVTYLLNVSDEFAEAPTKPNVDVFVLANVAGFDKFTERATLAAATVNSQFGLAQPLTTTVPDAGLPMAGVQHNVSVGGEAPVYTLPNVVLTRTVSKLRFVMSQEQTTESVQIKSITLNATMIPTTSYLFLADDNKKYHIGTGYNTAAFDFLNGTPLTTIAQNDDPMQYTYQTGTTAQEYEDLLATGIRQNKLTQIGSFYLFESDKKLSGIITYRGPSDLVDKTVPFTMSDAGDFTRNHTWTVYAYYGSTRLEVVSVYVSNWTDYPLQDHTVYNW